MSNWKPLDDVDLTCGLGAERESAFVGPLPDLWRFSENYMASVYDPELDLGFWLHWGACPDDFGLWEEMVLISLPEDGGFLWSRAYTRPPDSAKPTGPNLKFEVVDPFVTVNVRFDGVGVRTPLAEMLTGRVKDGIQELLLFDLQLEARAPAWDNHESAVGASTRGSMREQIWASEHYQQAIRATGTVRLGGVDLAFDGSGSRDHSRGQRNHKSHEAGGHNLWVAPFPSGKAFGMQRMWSPDGTPTLDVGFVFINGEFHQCDLVSPPKYLDAVRAGGEELELIMRSSLGDHVIRGTICKTLFCTYGEPWNFAFGAEFQAGQRIFAPGFCKWEWDGETSYGLAERSGPVGVVPGK